MVSLPARILLFIGSVVSPENWTGPYVKEAESK